MLLTVVALAVATRLVSLGGGVYETALVDPVWPSRPDIIQPAAGGISRKKFWIPVHVVFELLLVTSLVVCWHLPTVRVWLLLSLAAHGAMRIWSAFDFIPKALRFERGDPTLDAAAAERWARDSKLRLPLDAAAAAAALMALIAAAQAAG